MPPLEQFVKQLEDSGVLAAETLGDFLPPKAEPKDAEELVRELIRREKLTKYQAEEVRRGNGKSLVLGNYTILDQIGAGGMGQVFKAEHRRMHRIVAVKMLPTAMMQNAAVVARFEREVMAVAKLDHPNIVTAFDADNANGVHLLIMEYVEGGDLAALVKKNGPFSIGQAVNCIVQAARGLEAAHAAGIVHRDIKPANLLLDKQGTVKILDLGLARLSADVDSGKQAELTNTGTIMGTVDYMAPEQALDTKSADSRADIYSLGCSLFYLLTGKAMYQGDTLMKKLLAHRLEAIPSLRAIRPEVSEPIEVVFYRMVAKSVEDRYQTMSEVIADLVRLGTGQALSANMPPMASSTDTGLTDFLRDLSLAESAPVRRKKPAGPAAGKDKQKLLLIGGGIVGVLVVALAIWSLSGNRLAQTADGKKQVAAKPEQTRKKDVAGNRSDAEADERESQFLWFDDGSSGELPTTMLDLSKPFTLELYAAQDGVVPDLGGFPAPIYAFNRVVIGNGQAWRFYLTGAQDFQLANSIGEEPITEGSWVHLAGVSTGKKMLFFVDGKLVESKSLQQEPPAKIETPLKLGFHFIGRIDEIRVSQCARYEHDFTPKKRFEPDAETVGLYHCDEGNGTLLMDSSVRGNHGTLAGVSWVRRARSAMLTESPAFQKWMRQVALMPAEDQVKAVAAKLKELNPGFDGNITPGIVNGTVRTLSVKTNNVTNIAPVSALQGLSTLDCTGSEPGLGQLSDLAPLQGLTLDSLNASNTQVTDLSTLAGMPLSTLYCNDTPLVDLSPVKELPSLLRLHCNNSPIADLSPLAGSKLEILSVSRTQVSDLSPLHELPLIALEFAGTNVVDLSPLNGMKLTQLMCQNTPVVDLSPLAGMKSLDLLFIDDTPVWDLSPLKGLRLGTVHCVGTRVSDLSPLEGIPLTMLVIERTRVTDLSPIRGMPLFGIYFRDFRPERDAEILRSLRGTLQEINYEPANVFWREFEAQEAAIAKWKREVSAMPAEDQVRAVAARLKEFNAGFDGNVDHKIENGKVIALAFVSDNVTDITPVRAIEGLQVLSCPGSAPGRGSLAELWPLRGTKIKHLSLSNTAVANLSPLSQTQLTDLNLAGTPVVDLSPLERSGLARLHINDTKVTDLKSLTGLPLAFLDYSGVCVADASPLKTLPLKEVRCGFKPARDAAVLRSLSTLEKIDGKPTGAFWKEADARQAALERWIDEVAGMPAERQVNAVAKKLKELNSKFDGTVKHEITGDVVVRVEFISDHVTDITPVRALTGLTILDCNGSAPSAGRLADLWPLNGLPLQTLNCAMTLVSDLSPLRGMPLQALSLYRSQVSDLSPLAGLPLLSLHCGGLTNVADLSPLRGMPLKDLNAFGTTVTDLSPLRGMQLVSLDVTGATIGDLWIVKGMPLTSVACSSTHVATLAPLKGMPLTNLQFVNTLVTDYSPIRGMPLTHLLCDFSPLRDTEILRTLTTLVTINGKPAAEFWKEVGVLPAGK